MDMFNQKNSSVFEIFEKSIFYLLSTFAALCYGYALAKVGVVGYEDILTWIKEPFRPKEEEVLIASAFAMMYLPYYFTYFFKNRGYEINPNGENAHACSLFWLYRCTIFAVLYISLRGFWVSDLKKIILLTLCFICLCMYVIVRIIKYMKSPKMDRTVPQVVSRFITNGVSNVISSIASLAGIIIIGVLLARKFGDIQSSSAEDLWHQVIGNGSEQTGLVFIFALAFAFLITCICTNALYNYSVKKLGIMHQRFKIGIPISICVLLPLFVSYTYVRYEYVIFREIIPTPREIILTFSPILTFCVIFFSTCTIIQKIGGKNPAKRMFQLAIGGVVIFILIVTIALLCLLSQKHITNWDASFDVQMWIFIISVSASAAAWKYIGSIKAISSICGNNLVHGHIKTQEEFERFEHKYAMLINQSILLFVSVFSMLITIAFKPFHWSQSVLCLIMASLIAKNQFLVAVDKKDTEEENVSFFKCCLEVLALVVFVLLLAIPLLSGTLGIVLTDYTIPNTKSSDILISIIVVFITTVIAYFYKLIPRFHANVWIRCATEAGISDCFEEFCPSDLFLKKINDLIYNSEVEFNGEEINWKKEFEKSTYKRYYIILVMIPWLEIFLVVIAAAIGIHILQLGYILFFSILFLTLLFICHSKINEVMLRMFVKLWWKEKQFMLQAPNVKLDAINFDRTKIKFFGKLNDSEIPAEWIDYIGRYPSSMRIDNVNGENFLIVNLCNDTPPGEIKLVVNVAQFRFSYQCFNNEKIEYIVAKKAYSMKSKKEPYALIDLQMSFTPEEQGQFGYWVAYAYPQYEVPSLNVEGAKDNLIKETLPKVINVISDEYIKLSNHLISFWDSSYLFQFTTATGFVYDFTFSLCRDAEGDGLIKCEAPYVWLSKVEYDKREQRARARADGRRVSWDFDNRQ